MASVWTSAACFEPRRSIWGRGGPPPWAERRYCGGSNSTTFGRVRTSFGIAKSAIASRSDSLVSVGKLFAEDAMGQAHGSLLGRRFDRPIMALNRRGRPMWCSRLLY